MSNYWFAPNQFNPAINYQRQALMEMLMRLQQQHSMLAPPRPSWHVPDLVSPNLLMQGLRPSVPPPHFVGPPIQFQPPTQTPGFLGPPTQQQPPVPSGGPRFLGPPTQIGPTLPNLPSMKGY